MAAIRSNTPLEDKGVQVGDIIISINDKKITATDDIIKYLNQDPLDNNEISLTYSHKGKIKTVIVKPEIYILNNYGFDYGAVFTEARGLNIIKYIF